MFKIGLIASSYNEIKDFIKAYNFDIIEYRKEYKILIENKIIINLIISGIGKVNASYATSNLILNHKVNYIINIGTCGALKKMASTTINFINKSKYYDVDLTAFNYKLGEFPGTPIVLKCSGKENIKIKNFLFNKGINSQFSNILSGDSFINMNNYQKYDLIKNNTKFELVDMESMSIMQTCYLYNYQNTLIIKIVSDNSKNDENAAQTFYDSEKKYSKKILNIMKGILIFFLKYK